MGCNFISVLCVANMRKNCAIYFPVLIPERYQNTVISARRESTFARSLHSTTSPKLCTFEHSSKSSSIELVFTIVCRNIRSAVKAPTPARTFCFRYNSAQVQPITARQPARAMGELIAQISCRNGQQIFSFGGQN